MASQPQVPGDKVADMEQKVGAVKSAALDPDTMPDELFEKMGISRADFKDVLKRQQEREARTPAVGSPTPDFELELLSPEGQRTGERRRLSAHRGQPVGLVFGSYT